MKKYLIIVIILFMSDIVYANSAEIPLSKLKEVLLDFSKCGKGSTMRKAICDCAKNELERDNSKILKNITIALNDEKTEYGRKKTLELAATEIKDGLFGLCKWRTIDELYLE
jgi:hypothetical protein